MSWTILSLLLVVVVLVALIVTGLCHGRNGR